MKLPFATGRSFTGSYFRGSFKKNFGQGIMFGLSFCLLLLGNFLKHFWFISDSFRANFATSFFSMLDSLLMLPDHWIEHTVCRGTIFLSWGTRLKNSEMILRRCAVSWGLFYCTSVCIKCILALYLDINAYSLKLILFVQRPLTTVQVWNWQSHSWTAIGSESGKRVSILSM